LPLWNRFALMLTLLPALAFADRIGDETGFESVPVYSLQAMPTICVTRDSEEVCTMQLEIRWRGPTTNTVCLHGADSNVPLRCWQDKDEGQVNLAFRSANDVTLQLLSADGLVLRQVSISVVSRDVRDTRRRRRHVWSIL